MISPFEFYGIARAPPLRKKTSRPSRDVIKLPMPMPAVIIFEWKTDAPHWSLHRAPLAGRPDFFRCWQVLANLERRARVYD